jgi:polysaccharide biosynthesis/export protein
MRPVRWARALLLLVCMAVFAAAHAQDAHQEYLLGAGDSIRVTVFQNPDLTLEARVSEKGTITYPLVGTLKLGGLTISAAERLIANALREGNFIKQPQVNILPLQIRSIQVSVLGQVGKAGRYPLETFNTRVSEMIAIAGGIAPGGGDLAILTGTRDGKPFRQEIDVPALFFDKKPDNDFPVAGGDVIYVPRAPVYYVYGEVQKPGSYRVERAMTLRQALAQGGGPTARGTERGLRIYRRGADGRVETLTADLNDPVLPDDVLYVGESLF